MKSKTIISIGTLFVILSIISGAFGAHWLKTKVDSAAVDNWHTASDYMMYQGLGLLILGLWSMSKTDLQLKHSYAQWIILGTILFSGSIFLLSLKSILGSLPLGILGPMTPIGGLLMILGWSIFLFKSMNK